MTTAIEANERIHSALENLEEAAKQLVHALFETDDSRFFPSQPMEWLHRIERIKRRLDAAQTSLIAAAEARHLPRHNGATSSEAWLRNELGMSISTAKDAVQLARELPVHPAVRNAFCAGDINVQGASAICEALRSFPAETPHRTLEVIEEDLVSTAREKGPTSVARRASEFLHRLAPEALAAQEAQQQEESRLKLRVCPDGRLNLRGMLDRESGALALAVLGSLAAPSSSDDPSHPRDSEQRYADALVSVLRIAQSSDKVPTVHGERPTVVVTVGLETLCQKPGQGPGYLQTEAPISAATARRLACDARLVPLVLGNESEPLDVGRATYTPPLSLRRAVVARDRGCAFPGCDRPASWCDCHHMVHWADGGSTSIDNLCLLCPRHHTIVHTDGWKVFLGEDKRPWFVPPPWVEPDQEPRQHMRYRAGPLLVPATDVVAS